MPDNKTTNEDIKFSIIVASYNYENYIKETLDSILNQTYKNYEVIIVDDGSKDNSIEVIKKYTDKYDNFYLYTHENNQNKGLAETIKLAVSKATGEYVSFCESDDYWVNYHLQEKYNYIKNNPANNYIITNNIYLIGQNIPDKQKYIDKCADYLRQSKYRKLPFVILENNNHGIPTFSVVTIKKELLDAIDYNTPISPWLDWWLWRQVSISHSIGFIDKKLTYWRIHESYNTHNVIDNTKKIPDFIEKSNKLLKKYNKNAFNKYQYDKQLKNITDKLFSVKYSDNKKHKIITFLGCKVKIKTNWEKYNIELQIKNHYKNSDAPRILIVSHEFSLTGAPKVALLLADTLKKIYGISPVIISPIDGPIKKEFIEKDLYVIDTPKLNKDNLTNIANNFNITIIHSFPRHLLGNYIKNWKSSVLWYSHECFDEKWIKPYINAAKNTIINADKTLAGSPITQSGMNKLCPKKKTELLLYGMQDITIPATHNKLTDCITFIFPATIELRKGQDVLIDAIKKIPLDIQKKAKFILIGKIRRNDEYINNLQNSIDNISSIEHLNEMDFDELMKYYANTNVVVVPSRFDPMPMVATYAFMFKKLCILSDATGTATLVENDKNAIVFKNEDSDELAQKLTDIIINFNNYKKIAENGREIFEKHFSNDNFETNIKKHINALLEKQKIRKRKLLLQNIFSVKNDGIRKVITILGIKFKFKSKKLLKRRKVNKNSFLEDIFSIKNINTHKTITFCGIKLRFKSQNLTLKNENAKLRKLNKKQKKEIYWHKIQDEYFSTKDKYIEKFKYVLPLNTIREIIKNPNIKVVSFDIFDTLLYRPCINPTDIFYLVAKKVDKLYDIDFIKLRLNTEDLLNNKYANISEIYDFIQKHYNLDKKIVDILKKEEIACEKQLLQVRDDIKEIFDFALANNKKIIAVSDMYLTSGILKDILESKGYSNIDKIYVSNEYKARKDEGNLYDIVIEQENLSPEEICHIGDNFNSDYKIALKKYITAIHYPSIKDIVFAPNSIYKDVFQDNVSDNPITRILIAFSLFRVFKYPHESLKNPKLFSGLSDFVNIAFAPVLFHIALTIATDKEIQGKYNKVYFAARDGYLPQIAYDLIAKNIKNCLPSEYLYASRRAYLPAMYSNLIDWFNDNFSIMENTVKFENMINIIDNADVLKEIKEQLSKEELNIEVKANITQTINILEKINPLCEKYFKDKNEEITKYYFSKIDRSQERNIIFDIGYGGSISLALNKITNKKWDKIYLWQTEKNIKRDAENLTNTNTIFDNNTNVCLVNLLYEELFSPLEGSCISFDNLNPICEKLDFSSEMKTDLGLVVDLCKSYIVELFDCFGEYANFLHSNDTYSLQKTIIFMINKSPYCETSIFKNIIFPDPIGRNIPITLEAKLSSQCYSSNVFNQTAFNNPINYQLPINYDVKTDKKLGIHLHLFNIHLLNEIIYYLKDFPFKFDLIITICDDKVSQLAKNILNKNTIKNLDHIEFIVVPNRGRDVAPWLIDTKYCQEKYDLFCHVHTKESAHFGEIGNNWRHYLYDNLIQKNAIENIIDIVAQTSETHLIGIIFPRIFKPIEDVCMKNHIIQEGEFGEIEIIKNLSAKMKINRTYCYNTLLFSEGTMFWYNPTALKPLFDLNLTYEDFPKEPIGVGGTIAHAIERLPVYVCKEQGYECLIYNNK